METSAATPTRPPHPSPIAASPSPSASSLRLWRQAAQRNQWSRLVKAKDDWLAAAQEGSPTPTIYSGTDLGALKDMQRIRDKARGKLALREEQYRSMLLSSYQEMVHALSHLVNASRSMRCFSNVPADSAVARYSDCQADVNDSGDGGGIPLFKRLSILQFGTQRRGDAPSYEVLQVYLVTWRANVNINKNRLNEIFELAITEEGMPVKLS
ncbi:hypothetical protein PR202_gb22102 [Eleusine coracana subsp. coracana]|uniref:Uncharacterized protein n=1 Tax=Eleusine coracana subsp. coracana TaxID=191504 RepID=A0AAV5FCW5_ELECO|nr:hypothetical protein PR202_gb22102 [Eleusine coracana subsp. coracana]